MSTTSTRYGRDELVWDELVEEGARLLKDLACRREMTNYTDLNTDLSLQTSQPTFDFNRDDERAAFGYLLGQIVERTIRDSGVMLSSLVTFAGGDDAGQGFYQLARRLGLLPTGATASQKWEFWLGQVKKTHDSARVLESGVAREHSRVYVNRIGYTHDGVDFGDWQVIHHRAEPGKSKSLPALVTFSLLDLAQGGDVKIGNHDRSGATGAGEIPRCCPAASFHRRGISRFGGLV